jgi:DNA topoisomerase VI subunit B
MKLALELEFPDDQAANVLRLLQSVPDVTARILTHPASASLGTAIPLSEADRQRLVHELFGSWQSEESGEELARQLQEDRQDTPRDIAP